MWTWKRSSPTARTDQLTAVPGPRPVRPRTLRMPRVRRIILRSSVDQVAADTLEGGLRALASGADFDHVVYAVAVVIADEVIAERFIPTTLRQRVHRHTTAATSAELARLRPLSHRANGALDTARTHCSRCTPAELCANHQDVLWRWWDIRDTAAVKVVNAAIAGLVVPTTPASARPRRHP